MIGEIITVTALVLVIFYQGYVNWIQRKNFEKTEERLLDRIMTRSYAEFIQGEVAKEQVRKEPTPEEIYERQQEIGLPI
jgi:hypothetical protein